MRRLFLPLGQLLHREGSGEATQLVGGFLRLENQAWKRQSVLVKDLLPLSRGPRPGIDLTRARS